MNTSAQPSGTGSQQGQTSAVTSDAAPLTEQEKLSRVKDVLARTRTNGQDKPAADSDPGASAAEQSGDQTGAAEGDGGSDKAAEAKPEAKPEKPKGEIDLGDVSLKDAVKEIFEGRTLAEVAKALTISPDALYTMEIPLNDGSGRVLSVEDLKAGYLAGDAGVLDGERHEFSQQKAVFEGQRIEQENQVISARREISDILGMLGNAAPPDVIEYTRALALEQNRKEAGMLYETMPQLRDDATRQAFQKGIVDVMAPYGLSAAEALSITDHRLYKALDDFMRMKARLAEFDNVTGDKPQPPKTVKRRGKPQTDQRKRRVQAAIDKAKSSKDPRDKVAAVAEIMARGKS